MSNFIKIYNTFYRADSITKIDKYADASKTYDIRIWFTEGRCEFIEFKTEEERDLEFNKIGEIK